MLPLSEDEPYVYQVVNPEYEDELTQTWCELEDMDLGEGSHRPSAQGAGGEDLEFLQLTAAAMKVASVSVTAADKPADSKAKTVDCIFTHKVQTGRLISGLIPILSAYPERQVS